MKEESPHFLNLQLEATNEKTSCDRLYELTRVSTELAQLVAQNPGAPAELLEELANRIDVTIRKNVAANPNTPTETLLCLANEFPREVLSNPVFPLLLLEDLNILAHVSKLNTLWQIVLDAQTSTEILSMLVHPLARDANRIVRATAKANLLKRIQESGVRSQEG